MTSGISQQRGRRRRASARHFRKIETAIMDDIGQSLIDTFPVSDHPSWIPLARAVRKSPPTGLKS
jgi:hypothetical protein